MIQLVKVSKVLKGRKGGSIKILLHYSPSIKILVVKASVLFQYLVFLHNTIYAFNSIEHIKKLISNQTFRLHRCWYVFFLYQQFVNLKKRKK